MAPKKQPHSVAAFTSSSCALSLKNNEKEAAGSAAKHRVASMKIECGGRRTTGKKKRRNKWRKRGSVNETPRKGECNLFSWTRRKREIPETRRFLDSLKHSCPRSPNSFSETYRRETLRAPRKLISVKFPSTRLVGEATETTMTTPDRDTGDAYLK